jgi:hypothetical protein
MTLSANQNVTFFAGEKPGFRAALAMIEIEYQISAQ